MSASKPLVTGTDFITIATQDYDAAAKFYGDVLGLSFGKRWGDMPAGEFETGNLTLALLQTDAFGIDFKPNNTPIEFHVEDVAAARAELESRGVEFAARSSTPASATRRSSATRTGTRSLCTTATHQSRPEHLLTIREWPRITSSVRSARRSLRRSPGIRMPRRESTISCVRSATSLAA